MNHWFKRKVKKKGSSETLGTEIESGNLDKNDMENEINEMNEIYLNQSLNLVPDPVNFFETSPNVNNDDDYDNQNDLEKNPKIAKEAWSDGNSNVSQSFNFVNLKKRNKIRKEIQDCQYLMDYYLDLSKSYNCNTFLHFHWKNEYNYYKSQLSMLEKGIIDEISFDPYL